MARFILENEISSATHTAVDEGEIELLEWRTACARVRVSILFSKIKFFSRNAKTEHEEIEFAAGKNSASIRFYVVLKN